MDENKIATKIILAAITQAMNDVDFEVLDLNGWFTKSIATTQVFVDGEVYDLSLHINNTDQYSAFFYKGGYNAEEEGLLKFSSNTDTDALHDLVNRLGSIIFPVKKKSLTRKLYKALEGE